MMARSEFLFMWGLIVCLDVLLVHTYGKCRTNTDTVSKQVLKNTGLFPLVIPCTHIIGNWSIKGYISKISVHVFTKKNGEKFIKFIAHINREVILLTNTCFIVLVLISFFTQAGGPISKAHFVLDDALFEEIIGPFGPFCSSLLEISCQSCCCYWQQKRFASGVS